MNIKKFKKLLNEIKKMLPKHTEKAVRSFEIRNRDVQENVNKWVKVEKRQMIKTEYVRFRLNLDK